MAGYGAKLAWRGIVQATRKMSVFLCLTTPRDAIIARVPFNCQRPEGRLLSARYQLVIRFIVHAPSYSNARLKTIWGYRQVQSIIASMNIATWDFTP
jgi:hypothetical protein